MAHIWLIIVLFGNLKAWSDSPFNVLSTHNASQLRNVSRYGIKCKILQRCKVGVLPHLWGKTPMQLEKTAQKLKSWWLLKADVCICISHTLHLALPTFMVQTFRFSQDGADWKDCSIFDWRTVNFSKLTPKNKLSRRVTTSLKVIQWKRKLCSVSCYLQNGYFWYISDISRFLLKLKYSWNKGGGALNPL